MERRGLVEPRPTLSLHDFIRQSWHVLEPATPFVDGWHIGAISEFLTAMTMGQFNNGLVNIPPRHMKSMQASVMWPAWEWTFKPHYRYLTASFDARLSTRDARLMRMLVTSPWYKRRWGHLVQIAADQNRKMFFENTRRGFRFATGVGGGSTGEGGDRIIADDPMKALDAGSDAALDEVIDWWSGTMASRSNDPKNVARLIIMQRLHMRDLSGYVLDRMREGGTYYEALILPAEYEPARMIVAPDCPWRDPRTEPGELLWPERFDRPALDALKDEMGGPEVIAGQLQQRPIPEGGAIWLDAWWKDGRNRYSIRAKTDENPVIARWLSIDTAMKDKDDNDYSACTLFELLADYRVRLRPLWRERLIFPDLVDAIWRSTEEWRGAGPKTYTTADDLLRGVIIEDAASGTSVFQTLYHGGMGDRVIPFAPKGDKRYRSKQASLWAARDCVLLPMPDAEIPLLYDFEQDLYNFPKAPHDDTTDTVAQGIIYLENLLAEGWQARTEAGPIER
jgi:predicted phage terminase large subunit-like protein